MSGLCVAVVGANGRMGKEICTLLTNESAFAAPVKIDIAGEVHCKSIEESPSDVDVFIDFTLAVDIESRLQSYLKLGKPVVCGSTGLTGGQIAAVENVGKEIPILWSPNMSLGIAVVKKMLQSFQAIKNFDFGIEEFHHKHKVDRPSGTAIYLKDALAKVIGKADIEIADFRGGGIYGIHKVIAMSDEEVIAIEHTALNRTVFARGAVAAATWLHGKSAGVYKIDDLLNT